MKQSPAALRAFAVAVLSMAFVFAAGCRATMVSVTSNPVGAQVYSRGCGRIGFTWEPRGTTPVVFPSRFDSQNTMVKWPDGSRSDVQYIKLIGKDSVDLYFEQRKPLVAPAPIPDAKDLTGK